MFPPSPCNNQMPGRKGVMVKGAEGAGAAQSASDSSKKNDLMAAIIETNS
jgi:hypothetical protein